MGKRKRQPQGTGVIIPDALADAFENFLKGVPSQLKNDAALVLEGWKASPEPAEVSARTQKIDMLTHYQIHAATEYGNMEDASEALDIDFIEDHPAYMFFLRDISDAQPLRSDIGMAAQHVLIFEIQKT
jgi:hypothetical protein